MSGGWYADPTGRFGQRYFDGAAWTDHVVGANGQTVADTMPASAVPYPPPSAHREPAPPPAYAPPPSQGQAQSRPGAAGPPHPGAAGWYPAAGGRTRHLPGLGLAAGVVGLLLVALSILVLPWSDADGSRFLDISGAVRDAGSDAVGDPVLYVYVAWAGFVLLAATSVLVVLACTPLPRSAGGNSYARMIGAAVGGTAFVLHAVVVAKISAGPGELPLPGVLGLVGYAVVLVAYVVGARRVTR